MGKSKAGRVIQSSRLPTIERPLAQQIRGFSDTAVDTLLTHTGDVMHTNPICIEMVHYRSARLVKGKQKWYILFYQTNPRTGDLERFRDTFDLGRIPDLVERDRKALEVVAWLNQKLKFGYPFFDNEFATSKPITAAEIKLMSARDALAFAFKIKSPDLQPASLDSYKSNLHLFILWLEDINLLQHPIDLITESVAIDYCDYLTLRGLSGCTHNNHRSHLSALFTTLKDRKIIPINPWSAVKIRKEAPKKRQPVAIRDITTIISYLRTHDVPVLVSCLLQFYCMVRPAEQLRMKCIQINLKRSLIYMKSSNTKNQEEQSLTLPDQFRDLLYELGYHLLPEDSFILGTDRLGSTGRIGKNTLPERYRKIIRKLFKEGKISSIIGQSHYSWKDTGGDALADAVNDAIKLQGQFRHASLEVTQRYLSKRRSADPDIKSKHKLPVKS